MWIHLQTLSFEESTCKKWDAIQVSETGLMKTKNKCNSFHICARGLCNTDDNIRSKK
jgi:hypothetical protein